jgi:hypothetical protein
VLKVGYEEDNIMRGKKYRNRNGRNINRKEKKGKC